MAKEKMRVESRGWCVRVPRGEYFVGDPCYAVPDESWHDLLASCDYFGAGDGTDGRGGPVGIVNGHEVLAFGTAYGDGEYRDQFGHSYPVDAGLIGLTPVEMITDLTTLEGLGRIVRFDRDFDAVDDGEGRLKFGQIVIDTNDDDESEGW